MSENEFTTRARKPGPVIRLRLERKDDTWSIIKRIPLEEKTVPRSYELPQTGPNGIIAGFWFEAADKAGKTVYRQLLRKPVGGVEVFSRDGSISRIKTEKKTYTIDVLVPDWPEIERVRLFHVRQKDIRETERKAAGPARLMPPVAEFDLREEKSQKTAKKRGGKGDGNR